jgi:beta-glucosidase
VLLFLPTILQLRHLRSYEWADGYAYRFGLQYLDFKTQKRAPKLSAHFYKEVIGRSGLA